MKPGFSIIILPVLMLAILTLAGCATPTMEYDKASIINSIDSYKAYIEKYPYSLHTKKAKDKLAKLEETKRKKNQLKKNWVKLRKGMLVDEVDGLIGPLNRAAVISIRNLAENKNLSSDISNTSKAEGGFPYRDHYFYLKFDATGKLSEWSLK